MIRDPVEEESCRTPLEENRAAGDEVADHSGLLLTSVACKRRANFLDLHDCHGVPPAQTLRNDGDEGQALSLALLSCPPHLPVIGNSCSMSWCDGCPSSCEILKGVSDGDVEGCVTTTCPVGDEEVSRAPVVAWQEGSLLPDWSQARRGCSLKEGVSKREMRSPPVPHTIAWSLVVETF